MRRYSILHAFFMCFYSPALYRDVGQRWRGVGLGYMLLLTLLVWIPITMMWHYRLTDFMHTDFPGLVSQVPQINVVEGKLSIDRPVPYIIIDPDNPDRNFLVVDTREAPLSFAQADTEILVTRHHVTLKDNKTGKIDTLTFSDHPQLMNLQLNHSDIVSLVQQFQERWLLVGIYLICVLLAWCYRVLQLLIYALVGMLFTGWLKTPKDFDFLLRISAVALTPSILIATLLDLFALPNIGFLAIGLTIFYLYFGLRANRNTLNQGIDPDLDEAAELSQESGENTGAP